METWTLILVLISGPDGGAALERVPGIPTQQECEKVRAALVSDARAFLREPLTATCVRSREVLQPAPNIERAK